MKILLLSPVHNVRLHTLRSVIHVNFMYDSLRGRKRNRLCDYQTDVCTCPALTGRSLLERERERETYTMSAQQRTQLFSL